MKMVKILFLLCVGKMKEGGRGYKEEERMWEKENYDWLIKALGYFHFLFLFFFPKLYIFFINFNRTEIL